MEMRVFASLMFLLCAVVCGACRAETLQGIENDGRTLSAEILDVRVETGITVKVRLMNGVERELDGSRLNSANLSQVMSWLDRVCRINAAKVPHLRFKPSRSGSTQTSRSSSGTRETVTVSGKIRHAVLVVNAGDKPAGKMVFRLLMKDVVTEGFRATSERKVARWSVSQTEALEVPARGERKVNFQALMESSTTQSSTLDTSLSPKMAWKGETTDEAYVLVLDDLGRMIFFSKV